LWSRTDAGRGLLDLLRKGLGQLVLREDHSQVHPWLLEPPQDLEDAALGIALGAGRTGHQRGDHLAGLSRSCSSDWNVELVEEASVEGNHVPTHAALVLLVAPDHARKRVLENADDAPLGPTISLALHANHDSIPVDGLLEVRRRDEHLLRAPLPGPSPCWELWGHESVAAGAARQSPHDEVHARGDADTGSADLDERPLTQKLPQARLERATILSTQSEPPGQLAHRQRAP
jgi:hypothetical protein